MRLWAGKTSSETTTMSQVGAEERLNQDSGSAAAEGEGTEMGDFVEMGLAGGGRRRRKYRLV